MTRGGTTGSQSRWLPVTYYYYSIPIAFDNPSSIPTTAAPCSAGFAPMTTDARPPPAPAPTKHDPKDLVVPDEERKAQLKARIQFNLALLVEEAKQNQLTELKKGIVSREKYKAAMANLKGDGDSERLRRVAV